MTQSTDQPAGNPVGAAGDGGGAASPRPWVVVVVVSGVVLGSLAVALVVYLVTGHSGGASGSTTRWLAYTGSDGTDVMRVDLGPGGEAVPTPPPPSAPTDARSFVSGDGVKVDVRTLTLYNERWDDKEQLDGLVGDYETETLSGCREKETPAAGDAPLPTATPATGMFVRVTLDCGAGGSGGVDEIYAFVAQPERVNAENVRRDWVLVNASGHETGAVSRTLEKAVATLDLDPQGDAGAEADGHVPPDPGTARNTATGVWDGSAQYSFPAGWSLVGTGGMQFVAPADVGIDAVRDYRSPGIVIGREDFKPGGSRSESTLVDKLVGTYSQLASEHGCSERTDLEPSGEARAEILWTGCPNGFVDHVVVYPGDSGGMILVSVRASNEQVASDLVHELAG